RRNALSSSYLSRSTHFFYHFEAGAAGRRFRSGSSANENERERHGETHEHEDVDPEIDAEKPARDDDAEPEERPGERDTVGDPRRKPSDKPGHKHKTEQRFHDGRRREGPRGDQHARVIGRGSEIDERVDDRDQAQRATHRVSRHPPRGGRGGRPPPAPRALPRDRRFRRPAAARR